MQPQGLNGNALKTHENNNYGRAYRYDLFKVDANGQ
jgi:hypothetical protein